MLRFAPSPTGDMHIDSLRVAIINYLVAQQQQKSFLIRIDDTDKENTIEGKDTQIMQILEKFALIHDSVFHQSEHLHMHQTMAIRLLEQDKAFVCTCTQEEIEAEKSVAIANNTSYHYSGKCENKDKTEHLTLKQSGKPFVLRIKKPKHNIIFDDIIKETIPITPDTIDAFVILNVDGTPTSNFASACDDILSGVSTIIQNEKSLLDTAKQIHIQKQLGFDTKVDYAHLPSLFHSKDKDIDETSIKSLFEQGFIPDAIINYLIFISNPHAPKKIFTLPEAIKWFKLEDVPNTHIKFDMDLLRLINKKHLENMDDKEISSLFGFADAEVGKLAKLYLSEASTINELALKIRPIFAPKVYKGEWEKEIKLMKEIIADAPMIQGYDNFKSYIIQKSGLDENNIMTPLRILLTGTQYGPELSDIYPLIKSYITEIAS